MKKIIIFLVFLFSQNVIASQLIIGLPTNILFWKYWENKDGVLNEMLLIFNVSNNNVNISIKVLDVIDDGMHIKTTVDSKYTILTEPWDIEACIYKIVEFPDISKLDSYKNCLKFILNDSISLGLMSLNKSHPNQLADNDKIITTERINGGSGLFKCWWEQNTLFFKNSQIDSIVLKVIEDNPTQVKNKQRRFIFPIEYLNPDKVRSLNYFYNFQIECGTLTVSKKENENPRKVFKQYLEVEVPYSNNFNEEQIHKIILKFKIPKVEKPEVKYIRIWQDHQYGGHNMRIPIICIP